LAQPPRQAQAPAGREQSPAESTAEAPSPPALQLQLAATPEPPVARADPHRLQQCLTALVDNALLYTDGPVILSASSSPGVLPAEREAIIGRFVRGSAGLASPHRGSGADFQLLPPVKPLGPIS
jgi:signal transduction histidine kinase